MKASQPKPNAIRAERAEGILTGYCIDDDHATSLVDLLADAMHWCDARGVDFHHALAQACCHYVHELNDEQQDERRMIP